MIVVTAPAGNIGHHVVHHLLDAGEEVRLVARNPGKLAQAVRDRADVVEGSHGDAVVVDRAFAGAEAVFWIAPPDPAKTLEQSYLDFTRPAVEAIRRHGVGRVVGITALGRGTAWQDRAGAVTTSLKMDDMLAASGAAYRALAMPSFMDNALEQAATIEDKGMMFGPFDPDKKMPHTATRDMGAAATALLCDRSWSGRADVPLLGPEDLSFDDIAAIISEVIGREIRYQQVSFDAFKEQLVGSGMSESFAQGYVDMMRAKNDGMDNATPRTPENTGPTTFRRWAETELKPALAG